MLELNPSSFDAEVRNFDGVALIDFWASWCAPCRALAPVLEEVSQQLGDRAKVAKVRVDESENEKLAAEFGIQAIPAMKIFKNGAVVGELVGLLPAEKIVAVVEAHL